MRAIMVGPLRSATSFDGGLPLLKILLGLRQLHDVGGGILERDELAAAGQRYRIVERSFPARRYFKRSDARGPGSARRF
jgi:hypothetical protein